MTGIKNVKDSSISFPKVAEMLHDLAAMGRGRRGKQVRFQNSGSSIYDRTLKNAGEAILTTPISQVDLLRANYWLLFLPSTLRLVDLTFRLDY